LHQIYNIKIVKTKFILTLLFLTSVLFSQEKYDYYGTVVLNGDMHTIISYRLVFTVTNGITNGYSVTDLGGPHETKNNIKGTYNSKTKEFIFKEEGVLYTKSPVSDDMFCFINFKGKVKLINQNSKIEGDFKGLFNNKQKCIDGKLILIGSDNLYKKLNKLNDRIQKTNRISTEVKAKANPVALLDSLKVNKLIKEQTLTIFAESKKVDLEIWDNGKEDGDIINVFQNDELILRNYTVSTKKKVITVNLAKKNVFKIVAVNEGTIAPNTAMIRLIDGERTFEVLSDLKKNESASITILKRDQ
jgi:hypothetical protein